MVSRGPNNAWVSKRAVGAAGGVLSNQVLAGTDAPHGVGADFVARLQAFDARDDYQVLAGTRALPT